MKWILCSILFFPVISFAQDPDIRAVHNCALSYIEGMYEADAERMAESVHPGLIKQGFYWKGREQAFSDLKTVSYNQLISIAKEWNKNGWLPDDAPKDIEIYDKQNKIALVKVTAYWGVDYLQIVKTDNKWKIIHILWQNDPREIQDKESDDDQN